MLWVVTQRGRDKESRKVVGKFEDADMEKAMETATVLAERIVSHDKVSALIFLRNDNKEKPSLLRRVYRNWKGKVIVS